MATVIDELVVKLGMDTKGLKKGSEDAQKGIKDIKKNSDDSKKSVEGLGSAFGKMFAIVGGFTALKAFTQHVIDSSAELSRFSRNMDESTSKVNALQNAARVAGGEASDVTSAISAINKAQHDVTYTTGASPMVQSLDRLGVSLADSKGKAKEATVVLDELNAKLQKYPTATRFQFAQDAGFSYGMANILAKDRADYQTLIKKQEKNALTKSEAENLEKGQELLNQSKVGLLQGLTKFAASYAEKATDQGATILKKDASGKYVVDVNQDSKSVAKYLQSKGYAEHEAQGIAASLKGENDTFDPSRKNAQGMVGAAQWNKQRQALYSKNFGGKKLENATLKEQLDFLMWEHQNTEQSAYKALKKTKTAKEAQESNTRDFERTDNLPQEQIRRNKILQQDFGALSTNQLPSSALASAKTTTITVGNITINAESNDPKAIASATVGAINNMAYKADRSLA